MMNDAGIYLKHYPASQQIVASPSVLTWRIVCRVVQNLAATITSLDVSRNAGVDLEVRRTVVRPVMRLRICVIKSDPDP